MARSKVSPWGFVGMGGMACLMFLDLGTANVAPWCDLLFGTYHCPDAEERFELGLPEKIPLGYFKLLFGVFLPRSS